MAKTNKGQTELLAFRVTKEAKQKIVELAEANYLDLHEYLRQQIYKAIDYVPKVKDTME
jgi:hypothetical protein